MYKLKNVLTLILAVAVCLATASCRHVKRGRSMKLDICVECTELLNKTITKALEDLGQFSRCLEITSDSAFILHGSKKNIEQTKDEMVSILPTFIHQIELIQNAWEMYRLPACPQNLEKHLTRILCLSRGVSKRAESCLAGGRVKGPNSGNIIDYTGNYIRKVYNTLGGFVSNLQ